MSRHEWNAGHVCGRILDRSAGVSWGLSLAVVHLQHAIFSIVSPAMELASDGLRWVEEGCVCEPTAWLLCSVPGRALSASIPLGFVGLFPVRGQGSALDNSCALNMEGISTQVGWAGPS